MRRFHLVLLASLQLAAAARSRSFSIHDDLLAFPQFEVVFASSRVSEKQARALVERNNQQAAYSAEFPQATAAAQDAHATKETAAAAAAEASRSTDANEMTGYAYEILSMSPHRYLCSIPLIQPPAPVNETENTLAKAEEDRENRRAAVKGWELINDFEDNCLYYVSGWWSYSFCKNREIVQFHAISVGSNGQAPRRDPNGQEYILGQVPSLPAPPTSGNRQTNKKHRDDVDERMASRPPAELQMKGDQPYLVQRLEGGTICDLTGKERTVEVQYQCVPGLSNDRIGWIKEVVTCSYIMMVDTPRLCSDVAFQPAIEKTANPISCQLISDTGDSPQPLLDQYASSEQKQEQAEHTDVGEHTISAVAEVADNVMDKEKKQDEARQVVVGGVVVGGKKVLSSGNEDGKPVKLQQLANLFVPQPMVLEVIAQAASKADGGKIQEMTAEELESLNVDPKTVREMREKLKKLAGDSGWKMEIFQMNEEDEQELLGYIDDPKPEKGKGTGKGQGKQQQKQQDDEDSVEDGESSATHRGGKSGSGKSAGGKKAKQMENEDGDWDADGDPRGSEEEFYHGDEL